MDLNILQRAIPIKTYLQEAIVNELTNEELIDIRDSNYNESVVEKLIRLACPYYEESATEETVYVLALSIGTIIKEYGWGFYYISRDGINELQDRIRDKYEETPKKSSICYDLLSGNNYPSRNSFKFDSTDHIRFVNGVDVSGHNYGCNRQVEIQKNINGGEGYTVTIFNLDGNHPFWGNNVQMAPKQMRIINVNNNIVSLRGYGYDMMGGNFSDYGIDVFFNGYVVEKVVLRLIDRNIKIEYLK